MGVVLVRAFNPCVRNVPRPSLTFTSVISGIWDFRFSGVTHAHDNYKVYNQIISYVSFARCNKLNIIESLEVKSSYVHVT